MLRQEASVLPESSGEVSRGQKCRPRIRSSFEELSGLIPREVRGLGKGYTHGDFAKSTQGLYMSVAVST